MTLYRKLQRENPGTAEAVVSTLPLGRLLLASGSGRAALAQFDSYLRASARGPLMAEALYGKGQACALLDDVGEERATWWRLLADHAGSPYAPHARRRLQLGTLAGSQSPRDGLGPAKPSLPRRDTALQS